MSFYNFSNVFTVRLFIPVFLINANEGVRHESRGECHSTHSLPLTFLHPSHIAKAASLSYAGVRLAVHGVRAIVCVLQTAVARTMM